jgi:hypothetical protein
MIANPRFKQKPKKLSIKSYFEGGRSSSKVGHEYDQCDPSSEFLIPNSHVQSDLDDAKQDKKV